tara:strand:- start:3111 stop:3281 length:171 start_codon:yes stop_codon:yes gene_type:complete
MLQEDRNDGTELCDLIAKWITDLKVACGKGDTEACKELDRAKKRYEDELYAVYGGD